MTQQEFSQFLEMSPASLSSIFTGRTKPTLNIVESVKKKFDKINLEWLMFGKGPMYIDDEDSERDDLNEQQETDGSEFLGDQNMNSETQNVMSQNKGVIENMRMASVRDNSRISSSGRQPASFNDMKIFNNEVRKIKEIRVFYDDQTYESFVPKE